MTSFKAATLFLIALIGICDASGGKERSKLPRTELEEINRILENLEQHLRIENRKEICYSASKSDTLIKEYLSDLKALEPDYNWIEMNNVLISISAKYCEKKIQ